jgi:hypothetical protein
MAIRSRIKLAAKGTAIAGFAIGMALMFAPQSGATEAAPGVTVTPSSGLSNGDTVAVSLTGFSPNTDVFGGECAYLPSGQVACPAGDPVKLTTDADGAASTSLTVVSTFDGFLLDGTAVGTVDCHTARCIIGTSDASGNGAEATITFN